MKKFSLLTALILTGFLIIAIGRKTLWNTNEQVIFNTEEIAALIATDEKLAARIDALEAYHVSHPTEPKEPVVVMPLEKKRTWWEEVLEWFKG